MNQISGHRESGRTLSNNLFSIVRTEGHRIQFDLGYHNRGRTLWTIVFAIVTIGESYGQLFFIEIDTI